MARADVAGVHVRRSGNYRTRLENRSIIAVSALVVAVVAVALATVMAAAATETTAGADERCGGGGGADEKMTSF